MKVVVFAHRLEVGGTQTNAIELAAALRDHHGVDPVLFAAPGPMVRLAQQKGLSFVAAPDALRHPSPRRMAALRDLVRLERPTLVHAWDWWQAVEAYLATHLTTGLPLVVSDMMMELTRILPKSVPTTFGTPEIAELAVRAGRRRARPLVPPVDVAFNAPGVVDGGAFRAVLGAVPGDILVVTVSRLATYMKSESLYRTIEAVRHVAARIPIRFAVVGEGQARAGLERRAAEVNAAIGRQAIRFTGALLDPRPAYAAADIVVGMGGSALRGMAFGKPVVVVGDSGFCDVLEPATAKGFYFHGVYGRGTSGIDNERLVSLLGDLAGCGVRRADLGVFARKWVVANFSLETVARQLAECFQDAIKDPPCMADRALDTLRMGAIYLRERRFLTPSRDRKPIEAAVDNLSPVKSQGEHV